MTRWLSFSALLLTLGIACLSQAPGQMIPLVGAGGKSRSATGCTFPTLPSLRGRYRADVGVTTSGGNVTAVADQSGNGNDLSNSGTVPFNATGFNSLPAFDFAAGNNAALIKASFGMGTGVSASVFAYGQMNTGTASFGGAVVYGLAAANDFDNTGSAAFITRSGLTAQIIGTRNANSSGAVGASTGAHHRFGVVQNAAGITSYVDNVAGTAGSATYGAYTNSGTLVIGNRWSSGAVGGGAWDGLFVEGVVTNAEMSAGDLNNLDAYFTCQWGAGFGWMWMITPIPILRRRAANDNRKAA